MKANPYSQEHQWSSEIQRRRWTIQRAREAGPSALQAEFGNVIIYGEPQPVPVEPIQPNQANLAVSQAPEPTRTAAAAGQIISSAATAEERTQSAHEMWIQQLTQQARDEAQ